MLFFYDVIIPCKTGGYSTMNQPNQISFIGTIEEASFSTGPVMSRFGSVPKEGILGMRCLLISFSGPFN